MGNSGKKLPGPCSRCAGLRQKKVSATGNVYPYCAECMRDYGRDYAKKHRGEILAARKRRRRAEAELPGIPMHVHRQSAASKSKKLPPRQDGQPNGSGPAKPGKLQRQRFNMDAGGAIGKRPVNGRQLVLDTSPELNSLLDELLQLRHFGLTREAVALTLLRQRCEREALFFGDLVQPVVAALK